MRDDEGFRLTFTSADGFRTTDIDFLCDPNFQGVGTPVVGPNGGGYLWAFSSQQ